MAAFLKDHGTGSVGIPPVAPEKIGGFEKLEHLFFLVENILRIIKLRKQRY